MSQSPTQSPISIHAPRTGSDASERACGDRPRKFQSTLPARGATRDGDGGDLMEVISIHAPRTGSDEGVNQLTIREVFQSTLPARGATLAITMRTFRACYFNPRSPHGERRAYHTTCDRVADHFNPRSPHGERRQARREEARRRKISIHAPRTGSDADAALRMAAAMQFQSTLPARGATRPKAHTWTLFKISIHAPRTGSDDFCCTSRCHVCISIHAPRTGSDGRLLLRGCAHGNISIHAPRTGSDLPPSSAWNPNNLFQSTLPARGATTSRMRKNCYFLFQSTLPARGATFPPCSRRHIRCISIHAPRTGSDATDGRCTTIARHFNPRSPHGERLGVIQALYGVGPFQSTLPARGATVSLCVRAQAEDDFNPRSPHGERLAQGYQINPTTIFQSTLPARGATFVGQSRGSCSNISIHASRTGSDPLGRIQHHRREISIHAPRTGSDLPERKERRRHCYFNPRSPHGERHRVRDGFPGGQ